MREINVEEITRTVARLSAEASYFLPSDMLASLRESLEKEESAAGKDV